MTIKLCCILALLFAHYTVAFGQFTIPNANFEQPNKASSTGSLHWNVEGQPEQCVIDSTTVWKGKYSMYLTRASSSKGRNSSFYQTLPFRVEGLKKYKVSAAVKTNNVQGQFAGINVKVTDKDSNAITGYAAFKVKGTQDWKIYEGEFYADETATQIRVSGQLSGSGEVWFDDITIEELPLSTEKIVANIDTYINEYFDIVRNHSIVTDTAYITELQKRAKQLCAGISDMERCRSVLKRYVTLKLNDGHSFFLTPTEWKEWHNGSNMVESGWANFATGTMMDGNIAYISMPTFNCLDSVIIHKYVDSLQATIARLDEQHPEGWIIDISNNSGGNSLAMIAGIGPLLGNGICGYSKSAHGRNRTRMYDEGRAGWTPELELMTSHPYHLKNPHQPIAVIYGNITGSAGEVVAIAFRGKENTVSFGQKTSGTTTRVDNLELSDGARLNLACGLDVDRNGVVFGGKVTPDNVIEDHGEALAEATRWIRKTAK